MADNFEFEVTAKDNITKVIDTIKDSYTSLSKTVSTAVNNANNTWNVFKANIQSEIVIRAFDKLTDSAHELFNTFVVEGVQAAAKTQAAFNELSTSLARNGNYSKKAAEDFKEFADETESLTGVSDDLILSSASLLESITGLSEKGLKEATKAAIQLSAVTGKDLNSVTLALAKSMDNGSESLKRLGVNIGNIGPGAESFATTIKKINDTFGGAAEAKLNSFQGSLTSLSVSFENLQKSIGAVVIENPVVVQIIKDLSGVFKSMSEYVNANALGFRIRLGSAIVEAADKLGLLITGLGLVVQGGKILFSIFEGGIGRISALFVALGEAATGNFKGALDVLKQSFVDSFSDLKKQIEADNPFAPIVIKLAQMKENAEDAFTKTQEGATAIVEPISSAGQAAEHLSGTLLDLVNIGNSLAGSLGNPLEQFKIGIESLEIASTTAQNNIKDSLLASIEEQISTENEYFSQRIQNLNDQYALESAALTAAQARDGASEAQHRLQRENLERRHINNLNKLEEQHNDFVRQKQKERIANVSSSLGTIATLQQNSTGTLFQIGKAAALAQATIDGTAAVIKAYNTPFPLPLVLVPLTIAAVGAQIAKIASAQPPKLAGGIDSVPAGFGGDTFPALLNTGERVVPASSNEDLKTFLAENQGSKSILLEISAKLDRLQNQIVVNVGGKELINEIRSGLADGRSLVAT